MILEVKGSNPFIYLMQYLLTRRIILSTYNFSNFIFLYKIFFSIRYLYLLFKNIFFLKINVFFTLIFLKYENLFASFDYNVDT